MAAQGFGRRVVWPIVEAWGKGVGAAPARKPGHGREPGPPKAPEPPGWAAGAQGSDGSGESGDGDGSVGTMRRAARPQCTGNGPCTGNGTVAKYSIRAG